jgi:hypothetical protein
MVVEKYMETLETAPRLCTPEEKENSYLREERAQLTQTHEGPRIKC